MFNVAHAFDHADHLGQRYWRKRLDLPQAQPDVSPAALSELAAAISTYFRRTQGRGKHCHVDTYLRGERFHYFFAYPQDYTDTFIGYGEDGRFERRRQNPAFEVIFRYDPEEGSLELYAKGGKEVKESLEQLFVRTILHEELEDEERQLAPYDLNRLKNRTFAFPTDPADGIREVRIKQLRFSVIGDARQQITFDVDTRGEKDQIYDLIEASFYNGRLPLSVVNVTAVVFRFLFESPVSVQSRTVGSVV